jgi:hypothetical protein
MDDDTPPLLLVGSADDEEEPWLLLSRPEEGAPLLLELSSEDAITDDEEEGRGALVAFMLLAWEVGARLLLPAEADPPDDEPVPTAGSTGWVHAPTPHAINNHPHRARIILEVPCLPW